MSFLKRLVKYFNPAPDPLTPEQEANIADQRVRNTAELGDSLGLAQQHGLNQSEYTRAVQVWRQQVNAGTYVGSLESFIAARKF